MLPRAIPGYLNKFLNLIQQGKSLEKPTATEIFLTLLSHIEKLYSFYGDVTGVRIARKHISWYLKNLDFINQEIRNTINQATQPTQQVALVQAAFTP